MTTSGRQNEPQRQIAAEGDEPGLRFAYFVSKLDCEVCGDEVEVEGDVTNGEKYLCRKCAVERPVFNR